MPTPASDLAQQLLDAQVRYHLDRLSETQIALTIEEVADDLLAAAGRHRLEDVVEREAITAIVTRALIATPGSAALGGIVEMVTDVALKGPSEPSSLGEVVDRAQLEVLVDELLGLTPVLERALEQLTATPLAGTIASRFTARVVGEVLQANKAMADKVPGLGALVSFGTSTASRVVGAADRQLDGLLGETAGKGGTFAVRRLNRIVIETLQDQTTRDAVLQVWDLIAEQPVVGLGAYVTRAEVTGVVDAAHDLAISTLATDPVAHLAATVVDAFFDRFGGYTGPELLDALDLDRDDLVADLVRLAPGVLDALRESGDLARLLRAHLEPFYTSPEVSALLG